MTEDDRAQASTRSGAKLIELVELAPEVIHALAAGDLTAANRAAPLMLSPYFVAPECMSTWRLRSRQVNSDPTATGWITRIIVDAGRQEAVGRAGYHGPPNSVGMVEVGYAVDPAYRRQGYARAALVALLDRARREPSVRTVRATISPDNLASRQLVAQYAFVEVGEQYDDEDGPETIFEVDADLTGGGAFRGDRRDGLAPPSQPRSGAAGCAALGG